MFARKQPRLFKGKPVRRTLPNAVLLGLLVVVCLVCLLLADYYLVQSAKTETEEGLLNEGKALIIDSVVPADISSHGSVPELGQLSRSEALHEEFRLKFHSLLNERILANTGKALSDFEVAKLLSELYASKGEAVNFVQVGACDGEWVSSNDPIQRLMMQSAHWHGVLLEPVPYLFDKLKANIDAAQNSGDRLHLVNAALSDANGKQPFYIVNDKFAEEKPGETHALKHQIGSFNKDHITKHLVKLYRRGDLKNEVDDYIKVIQVNSMTPDKVVESFRASGIAARDGSVDILIIDAEGYDLTVLQSFMRIPHLRPAVIVYETLHLTDTQKKAAADTMRQFGYTVWPAGWNALAVRAARVEPQITF